MVHMHHSQPLKMKFGTNHFLGSETLVPLQYRVRVKQQFMYTFEPNDEKITHEFCFSYFRIQSKSL